MIMPASAGLFTPAQMAQADAAAAAAAISGAWLMAQAGHAVARAVRRHFRPCRVLVLCGPGNNGGDGYVAAQLLAEAGWPIRVAALAPARPGSDAAAAAAQWRGPMAPFTAAEAARAGLVIDAVFGAGLARDLPAVIADTLAAAPRILAVDMPSGVDGATGAARGRVAQAEITITFARRKPGHLLLPGRVLCGAVECADIGLPTRILDGIPTRIFANGPALWQWREARLDDHKYSHGDVTILGGAAMPGAARLAAEAARHAGAGLVSIATTPEAAMVYRLGAPGLIVNTATLPELLEDTRRQVWLCGPGLAPEQAAADWARLRNAGRQVVLDAGALTACAGNPHGLRGAAIITPHGGEFARVFGEIGHDRVAAARRAAQQTGAVVVLKGADTVVAAPDGVAAINESAPPFLATAGAGDVLAGLIVALLGQGMQPFPAACAGVWLHGMAAQRAGPGLLAEDLPPAITAAMAAARGGGKVQVSNKHAGVMHRRRAIAMLPKNHHLVPRRMFP